MDMGLRNFAFAEVEVEVEVGTVSVSESKTWGHVRRIDVHDLTEEAAAWSDSTTKLYRGLIVYLDRHQEVWQRADVILVEQQLNRLNIVATKLACHVMAYFLHRFPEKRVVEFPSSYKGRYLKAPPGLSHPQRKQWAIKTVMGIYQDQDPVMYDWILTFPKRDDIADCILMANLFPRTPLFSSVVHP